MTVYHPSYDHGHWQVVATSNGIDDRANVGPRWNTAREAAAYVDHLEGITSISPLRDPVPISGQDERVLGGTAGSPAQRGAPHGPVASFGAGPLGEAPSPVGPEASLGFWPD